MMDLENLARLAQRAIEEEPPAELRAWCEPYYDAYYHLLYLLALHTEHACVELGVEKGRGSFAMCLAGREVHGYESHPRDEEMRVMRARFPGFHFHHRPSLPAPAAHPKVGVLHVDTEHSFAMAREEFAAWRRHLAPGAVACFDDLHAQEHDVGRFVASLGLPAVMDDRLHSCGYAAVVVP
jgi:hypothetical protein